MAEDIAAEFAAFIRERDRKTREHGEEIEYVEVWDEKNRGARVPIHRAKDILAALGCDVSDLETDTDDNGDSDGSEHAERRSLGRQHRHESRDDEAEEM